MPLKTILAIIQSEEDAERVSNCAGTLAARHEAHLIGLHAEALPIPYTSTIGFPDAEFIQASTEVNQERSKKIEAVFRQRTADAGITAEWRSLESFSGDSAHSGIASARSCDLVVAGQAGSDGASPDVDALLYDAGRPVLVTPHDAPCLASFRRVIVAWNGSREAARAAFDARAPSKPAPTSPRRSNATAQRSRSIPRRRADWRPTTWSATASPPPARICSCLAHTAIPGCASCSSAASRAPCCTPCR